MGNFNSGRRPKPVAFPHTPERVDDGGGAVPPELSGKPKALDEWRRLAPLVAASDRAALTALCLAWASWLDAQAKRATAEVPHGRIARESFAQCVKLWRELGLTPRSRASRGRGIAAPSAPSSKWDAEL